MAKSKSTAKGLEIDFSAMNVRERIPNMFTDAYMIKLEDAEEGVAEGRVINNIDVTGFAVIVSVFITDMNVLADGKTLRINGEHDIDLSVPEGEVSIFEKVYVDKEKAHIDWRSFMEDKVANAEKILHSYTNLVEFLRGQLKEELY